MPPSSESSAAPVADVDDSVTAWTEWEKEWLAVEKELLVLQVWHS